MNKYSVWYMSYNKRYLLTHPWQWFKCVRRNIRDAWRRSVYGWTYSDVWDWDSWFLHTVPDMLRYMADHGSGYPGRAPFDTAEKWHDWLHEMADLLETGREDWQDEHNEYHDAYMKEIMSNWKPARIDEDGTVHHITNQPSELHKKYFARSQELAEQGEANVRRVMCALGEHFYDIWD